MRTSSRHQSHWHWRTEVLRRGDKQRNQNIPLASRRPQHLPTYYCLFPLAFGQSTIIKDLTETKYSPKTYPKIQLRENNNPHPMSISRHNDINVCCNPNK